MSTISTLATDKYSVKNTFVELNFEELNFDDEPYRRQATEPVPCTRKLLQDATPKALTSIAEGVDTADTLCSIFFPDTDCEDSDSIDGGCSPETDSDSIGSPAEQENEAGKKSRYDGSDEDSSYLALSGIASMPYQYSAAGMASVPTWPTPAMGYPLAAYPTAPAMDASWANVSTVMMRNLPNKVNQEQLLTEMNGAGFLNTYDFVYLPIDPDTHANKGYAFINFLSSGMAWIFKMHFEGEKLCSFHSKKTVAVVPATLQGFEANHAHYAGAHVQYRDLGSRPLFLREPAVNNQRLVRQRDAESLIDVASKQLRKQQQQQEQYQQFLEQQNKRVVTMTESAGAGSPSDTSGARVAKFCCNCGGGIQASFKFCKFCGSSTQS